MEIGKAIEKLRSHQAENPHHYVNRLLRAGYLCGAQRIEVRSDARRTRVEFRGATSRPDRLGNLLEELFQNHGSAAHELANAANLAFGIAAAKVEIKIDDGEQARVLVRRADGRTEIYQVESLNRPRTTFQLDRRGGQALKAFGANSPEYLSIVRRFRLAPFEISINKETPPRGHAWGKRREKGIDAHEGVRLKKGLLSLGTYVCKHHHVAEVRLYGNEPIANGIGLSPSTASSIVRVGNFTSGEQLDRCRMAFGLRADSSLESTAAWVYRGETLQIFPAKLALPGVEIAINASDLQLDATQERLVQNDAFKNRWEEAKREFNIFAAALQASYGSGSASKLVSSAFYDKKATWAIDYEELRSQADSAENLPVSGL